ncbi:MAG TPA: hypothetical protein VLJ15_02785 [Gammaproteobacteria bacterium]|nr:hypothetical protein [Gammaproteobacteria bacterium]
MQQQKNIFVVLGVARSGTSAIVRGLKALGIDLGAHMTPGNEKWNAKGFFEDTDIVYNIHGAIFSALHFAPYGMQALSEAEQTDACLAPIREAAIQLLQNRFLKTDYWGFKDPSTVKLLAFWQSIFREMHIQENYIIALRNPLAMAESYQHVTGSDIEVGLLLWLMHLIPAVENTHGKKRIVINYERLLEHPDLQLERIRTTFALPELSDLTARETYTEDFLDKKLHRHARHDPDLVSHPAMGIAPLCTRVWHLLMKVATDALNFEHPVFQSEWQTILLELEQIKPVYDYLDRLLKNNHQLKKNLRDIHKSVLWKMLYPLRRVDSTFRKRRQAARLKKRLSKAYG